MSSHPDKQVPRLRLNTVAVRAGHAPDPASGAIAKPIVLSTTFEREIDGGYPKGYRYSREGTPNREALEHALAALDEAADAAAFSSGLAACSALLQALKPGDHIVCPTEVYYGVTKLLNEVYGPWGITHTAVDATDPAAIQAALRPTTALVMIETPSNPTLALTDIRATAQLAHAAGARLVVDNTFATPLGQRCIEEGADFVLYSTTKYHGGHSDVLGGALVSARADALWEHIRLIQRTAGTGASPFDAWLVHRGLASLPCRFEQQCRSAQQVAEFLAGHPAVERVFYPGLSSHPGHDLAVRQMRRFGGMLSLLVKGDGAHALAVAGRLQLFTRATSLGGVESLVEHRQSVEGSGSRTAENLLRVSIGLEDVEDLIDDLKCALA